MSNAFRDDKITQLFAPNVQRRAKTHRHTCRYFLNIRIRERRQFSCINIQPILQRRNINPLNAYAPLKILFRNAQTFPK